MKPGWTTATLGDVATIVSGATPKTGTAEFWDGDIAWATPRDLSALARHPYLDSTPRSISQVGLRSCAATVLPAGSVLFSSRAPIGHVAINSVPMATNQGFKSFMPKEGVLDAKYLYHWLRANRAYLESLGNGATFKEVSKATVSRVAIPLPPVEEQRRIAAILDTAESVRYRRQLSIAFLTNIRAALLHRMDRDVRRTVLLGQVSEIQGGIQVSSKRAGLPMEVPYLRVANVARGKVDLTEVKTIRVTERELSRVRLEPDDLLLVEGHGNPAEVGRAARWPGGVPDMVHQNHLIRVRAHSDRYLPVVLEALVNSASARRYFGRAGKTTSGLNTITTSNVRALPVPEVDMSMQRAIAREVQIVQGRIALAEAQASEIARLCTSLQARAFSGRL